MRQRFFILFLLSLSFARLVNASTSDSRYVFHIEASGCQSLPLNRSQTGFRLQGISGIVTALHGVAGCNFITARQDSEHGQTFTNLILGFADRTHDAALLTSTSIRGVDGFQEAPHIPEGPMEVWVIGHPSNVPGLHEMQLSVPTAGVRLLGDLVPPGQFKTLQRRASPSVAARILSVNGDLQPGHSGAPIVDGNRRVIAIANGGLAGGTVGIGWGILLQDVAWKDADQNAMNDLGRQSPNLVFDYAEAPVQIERLLNEEKLFADLASSDLRRGVAPIETILADYDRYADRLEAMIVSGQLTGGEFINIGVIIMGRATKQNDFGLLRKVLSRVAEIDDDNFAHLIFPTFKMLSRSNPIEMAAAIEEAQKVHPEDPATAQRLLALKALLDPPFCSAESVLSSIRVLLRMNANNTPFLRISTLKLQRDKRRPYILIAGYASFSPNVTLPSDEDEQAANALADYYLAAGNAFLSCKNEIVVVLTIENAVRSERYMAFFISSIFKTRMKDPLAFRKGILEATYYGKPTPGKGVDDYLRSIDYMVAKSPPHADIELALVNFNAEGKYDEAEKTFREYIRENPTDYQILVAYVDNLREVHSEFARAIRIASEWLPGVIKTDSAAASRLLKGRALAILFGEYDKTRDKNLRARAKRDLEMAVHDNPALAEAHFHLGIIAAIEGDLEQAERRFGDAEKTSSENDFALAIASFRAMARKNPAEFIRTIKGFYHLKD